MVFDIYMILLSAFALFGVYCFLELAVSLIDGAKSPKSVLIMKYGEDDDTYKKVRFAVNNMFNNEILFLDKCDKKNNIYSGTEKLSAEQIEKSVCDILIND